MICKCTTELDELDMITFNVNAMGQAGQCHVTRLLPYLELSLTQSMESRLRVYSGGEPAAATALTDFRSYHQLSFQFLFSIFFAAYANAG